MRIGIIAFVWCRLFHKRKKFWTPYNSACVAFCNKCGELHFK